MREYDYISAPEFRVIDLEDGQCEIQQKQVGGTGAFWYERVATAKSPFWAIRIQDALRIQKSYIRPHQ